MTVSASVGSSHSPTRKPLKMTSLSRLVLPNPARMFRRGGTSAEEEASLQNHRKSDTEFFASLESSDHNDLGFFRRSEVEAGDVIGRGTFTNVRTVTAIWLSHDKDEEEEDNNDSSSKSNKESTRKRRQEVAASVIKGNTKQPGQRQYVIKQLTTSTLKDSDKKTLAKAARELVNDAKFLTRLAQHENIVQLRGLTLDAFGRNYLPCAFDDFFLLLDRLTDDNLSDRIRSWRHKSDDDGDEEPNEDLIPRKANYAFQIAKAIRHCHQQGVLYRNLQPQNIGFDRQDPHQVKLLDFGLAREFPPPAPAGRSNNHAILYGEDAAHRLTMAGTRRYLAGEVLATGGEYTWKSDVYSWAVVYFEMCTERKPYSGLSAADHQTLIAERGERPDLENYYLPDSLDEVFTMSWHPLLSSRWSMDQVCCKMQTFLMELDVAYYEQKADDFLFDVAIEGFDDDEIEDLEYDEDYTAFNLVGGDRSLQGSSALLFPFVDDDDASGLKQESYKSTDDSAINRSGGVRVSARKVISTAA